MAQRYVQEVLWTRMNAPAIEGFQCMPWAQDPEDNSLFKALSFTPWACEGPLTCGSVSQYNHLLRNCGCLAARPYSFERARRLRCAEIHVLAARADSRCRLALKRLVLADTTLFSELKEPQANLDEDELVLASLAHFARSQLVRRILAFSNHHCRWHEEKCTLAELRAYVARHVLAHVDIAAEARVKSRPAAAAHLEAAVATWRMRWRTPRLPRSPSFRCRTTPGQPSWPSSKTNCGAWARIATSASLKSS